MELFVKSKIESGVGRITLCRAEKRNALKRIFIEQLSSAVDTLAVDDSLRALVLQAEGSVFCAGMDLGEMQERAESADGQQEWQKDSKVFSELLQKLYNLNVPTIAVMQGPALAGGVGLILACDFIIADKNAFVMLPEPARGITAAMVTPFLIHRIGAGRANQLLLSGQPMAIPRCHELGLVYCVAQENELEEKVNELLTSIMTGSKAALAITKKHVQGYGTGNLSEYLADSIGVSAQARETDDAREGLAAFLEKRKPKWQG